MKINNETKIGIFVVVVGFILFMLTWKAGNFRFSQQSYTITVTFKNIDGVALNSPVMLNGFEVGRVRDIHVVYGEAPHVELTLWLKGDTRIPRGTTALVKNMGFMGEKYIGLIMNSTDAGYLKPYDVIAGKEPASFENILQEGEKIAVNIRSISEQLDERLKVNSAAIDDIVASFRATLKNVATVSSNINERIDVNKRLVDEMIGHLTISSRNLEEMSCDLKENPWKLLYKPKNSCPLGRYAP